MWEWVSCIYKVNRRTILCVMFPEIQICCDSRNSAKEGGDNYFAKHTNKDIKENVINARRRTYIYMYVYTTLCCQLATQHKSYS